MKYKDEHGVTCFGCECGDFKPRISGQREEREGMFSPITFRKAGGQTVCANCGCHEPKEALCDITRRSLSLCDDKFSAGGDEPFISEYTGLASVTEQCSECMLVRSRTYEPRGEK